jgi:bleomycin hydrolase
MGDSSMTHAMVFTGVHLDNDGKIVKFKVENAWGTATGRQGWFMMTSAWFDQYVKIVLLLCTYLLQIDMFTK